MGKNHFFKSLTTSDATTRQSPSYMQAYVHPCVIDSKPHIVYPRGLKEKSPGLFSKLTQFYQQQGYALKEDQRSENSSTKFKNERRKWFPVLLFTASLMFESAACADVELEVNEAAFLPQNEQIKLQLISNKEIRQKIQYQVKPQINSSRIKIKSELAQSIFDVLHKRYQNKESDPSYIIEDLKEIANYYSEFPESVALITALKDKNWFLSFDENNWVTTGSGSMLQVDKAVIHFNTRAAAQLRLNNGCTDNPVCIASPADALLHELLHAHSMLVESEKFVEQGGMNNVMYPYKHEYSIIDAERNLYASMSTQDEIKRPQRREHTGRIVKAHCPTCIK